MVNISIINAAAADEKREHEDSTCDIRGDGSCQDFIKVHHDCKSS